MRDDWFDTHNMDKDMPKLPSYVFRRANGSYRYKRNVPKKLVGLIGKGTLYRQLGESYTEAMRNLPQVHYSSRCFERDPIIRFIRCRQRALC